MILLPNLQTTLFMNNQVNSTLKINYVYIIHYLFKSVGGTTIYENPGENTVPNLGRVIVYYKSTHPLVTMCISEKIYNKFLL